MIDDMEWLERPADVWLKVKLGVLSPMQQHGMNSWDTAAWK